MTKKPDISVALLHENMHDKQGKIVTTSLTMIDLHDIARSSRTYGVTNFFVCHPSPILRKLAKTLKQHWEEGFGATYNPNRKEALEYVEIVEVLDNAVEAIRARTGRLPVIIATSAKEGGTRVSFTEFRKTLHDSEEPQLLLFGTGWGMSDALLSRAKVFLDPIRGPTEYNHLSVRSACAIVLDRLLGL